MRSQPLSRAALGLLGRVPVAHEDVGAAHEDFAFAALGDADALLRHVDETYLDAWEGGPDAAEVLLVVVREAKPVLAEGLDGHDGRCLGHAPALEHGQAEAGEVALGLGVEGRAAADEEAQVAAEGLADVAERPTAPS